MKDDEIVGRYSESVPATLDEFGRMVIRTTVEFICSGCDEAYYIEVTVPLTDMPSAEWVS